MAKNETKETKETKQDISKRLEEIEQLQKKLKDERKELQEKYTFKGMYSKLAGRKNILVEIRDDSTLTDNEKIEQSIDILNEFIESYQ